MSEIKHVVEPWFAVEYSGFFSLQTEDTYSETDVMNGEHVGYEKAKASAERAAQCVNALAGIENPEEWVKNAKAFIENNIEFEQKQEG